MAKYSGGKAGAKYGSGKAGKSNSLYMGDKYSALLGRGKSIYNPARMAGKGDAYNPLKMGKDGASHLDMYMFGRGIMDSFMDAYKKALQGYKPGDGVDPLEKKDRKYEKMDESDEDSKPCLMCGEPAINGSPFCLVCITKN